MAQVRLPPGCGEGLKEPLLYNEHQQRFTRARRMRFCLNCRTAGSMDEMGKFRCAKCGLDHNGKYGNLTAPRAFNRFLLLAGRGGGKTLIGAHAVREELMVPESTWWVMSDTYKRLHDSTFPTLVGLLHPNWILRWDPEHVEITLKNKAMVAFRSLEDPDRARGPHGVNGTWYDEAALCPERSWHVGNPMLIKAGGIALATTTVRGYDWTYEQIERKALVYHEPGYWTAKWFTSQNPLFQSNPVMRDQIERARKAAETDANALRMWKQEYECERSNAEGLIYGELIRKHTLHNDEEVKRFIPEWPNIDPSRKVIVGVDEGADHPFGAMLIVITEKGLVVVSDYLERMKAFSAAHDDVYKQLHLVRWNDKAFFANKNALNLRLEWGLKGTGVAPVESRQEVGIQRVQAWLLSGRLKFAYTATRTIEQCQAYRYADNYNPTTGEKKNKEAVYKLMDELCDCLRYALMGFPEIPDPTAPAMTDAEQARWDAFDERTKWELERMKELRKNRDSRHVELQPTEDNYPQGNIFMHDDVGY